MLWSQTAKKDEKSGLGQISVFLPITFLTSQFKEIITIFQQNNVEMFFFYSHYCLGFSCKDDSWYEHSDLFK